MIRRGVLSRFFLGRAIEALTETLRAAPGGAVAVIGHPRLARALAERGHTVTESLPDDRSLGAVVGWGAGARDDWQALLAGWSRAVVDGGLLVMVDRAPPAELSRRALCGGLAELQQRAAGRLVVTSGVVTDL